MALTLSSLMARAWREIGFGSDIAATGGATASIVDTNTRYTTDNALLNGTAIVTRDAGGAGAAPEGEYAKITGFTASSKTFAFATGAFTVAVAAGDAVFLANPRIPLQQMIEAANDGLTDLGYIDTLDTSLTLVAGIVQYTLPVALKSDDLVDVLFQTDATFSPYSIKAHCRVEPSPAGTTAILWMDGFYSGTARVFYNGSHPRLTAYNSVVNERIPPALAVAAAIDKALTWYVSKRGESALGTMAVQRWNDAKQTLANTKVEHPIFKTPKKPRWFSAGGNRNIYIGDQSIYKIP